MVVSVVLRKGDFTNLQYNHHTTVVFGPRTYWDSECVPTKLARLYTQEL